MQYGSQATVEEYGWRDDTTGDVEKLRGGIREVTAILAGRRRGKTLVRRTITGRNPVIGDGLLAGCELRLKTGRPMNVVHASDWQPCD